VVSGLLGFMAVTGYAGMLNIKGIAPLLLPPEELYANHPAVFRLVVHNCKQSLPSFLISATSPSGGTILPFLAAGSTGETGLELVFPARGRHPVGRIRISSPFPVNFFTRSWEFTLHDEVLVFPEPLPVTGLSAADGSESTGETARTIRGQDGELEGIRGYSGVEPLRSIHWRLSARDHQLLVKEFGTQAATPLLIRLDQLPGAGLETRLSQAAWLIRRFGGERPVGLALPDRTLAPAIGRRHCLHLLTELALYDHQ
jgi:uncharacterized protein (DUF58 family)